MGVAVQIPVPAEILLNDQWFNNNDFCDDESPANVDAAKEWREAYPDFK